jgi:hypothetical protein
MKFKWIPLPRCFYPKMASLELLPVNGIYAKRYSSKLHFWRQGKPISFSTKRRSSVFTKDPTAKTEPQCEHTHNTPPKYVSSTSASLLLLHNQLLPPRQSSGLLEGSCIHLASSLGSVRLFLEEWDGLGWIKSFTSDLGI